MTRTAPEILAVSAAEPDAAQFELRVPPDLVYLRGHFPDVPVLPGVVQIKWALDLAAEYLGLDSRTSCLEAIKFRSVIRPDDLLTLTLRFDAGTRKLHFEYHSDRGIHGSGRVLLSAAR